MSEQLSHIVGLIFGALVGSYGAIRTGVLLAQEAPIQEIPWSYLGDMSAVGAAGLVGWYMLNRIDKYIRESREDMKASHEACEQRILESNTETQGISRRAVDVIDKNTAVMAQCVLELGKRKEEKRD